jgi:Inner membrane component of T3SS, cytoplasmic domain
MMLVGWVGSESAMSFRLFVYYCAVVGAWSGFVGWVLGRNVAPTVPANNEAFFPPVLHESIMGLALGFAIAFGISLLDATFSLSLRNLGTVLLRVFGAVIVGIMGGLFGAFVGSALYHAIQEVHWTLAIFAFVLGWTIVGFLVGMSISFFEVSAGLVTQRDFGSAVKKFVKCVIGGTVGGLLGGLIAGSSKWVAGTIAAAVSSNVDVETLRTPTAVGFIAIGACIGLLVGLAQVILKEAWIKVEAGFRPGREMLLAKERTTIGRAEGCDIALFGDSGVEKAHANILLEGGRYFLEDLQTPGGSYVNDQKVDGRMPLRAGDLIRVGKSMLRFNERAKRKD